MVFQSHGDLKGHKLTHMKENEKQSIVLTATELKVILEVHELLENIMAMAANRGQEMSLSEISKHCEQNIKTQVGDDILKATISINPLAYFTYAENGKNFLRLATEDKCIFRPVTPKTLKERRLDF